MDQRERQVIDDLFAKFRKVESQSPQRDPEAEAYIARQVAAQPAVPYYMAQALLAQEQALANAQARVQALEKQAAERSSGSGGFLAGIFGGGQPTQPPPVPRQPAQPPPIPPQYAQPGMTGGGYGSPWGRPMGMGGGFLAGAMQTALGVAGGMLVADALQSAFSHTAEAAAPGLAGLGDALGPDPDILDRQPDAAAPDMAYDDPGFDADSDFSDPGDYGDDTI